MLSFKEKVANSKTGFKGIGNILVSKSDSKKSWNILNDDICLPAATLSHSVLKHNQSWMNKFAERFDFQLAPHGKTTMLPDLFSLQISNGCWGITLANVSQVAAAYKSGVKRIIMANQLVGQCNMDIISTLIDKDPTFEFICLVDSPENIAQIGNFFEKRNQRIKVLLEFGPMGGRTGIRNNSQEEAIVDELRKWSKVILAVGIEFFEGILTEEKSVRSFIHHCLSRIQGLADKGVFQSDQIIVTGAGTSWFDVVAEEFQRFEKSSKLSIKKILRAGCYLIYDNGLYQEMEKRVLEMKLGASHNDQDYSILCQNLKPALKIWAYVQSVPEPNLAIVGMGRRDVAEDSGYPVPHSQFRLVDGSSRKLMHGFTENNCWKIFKMMDQHAYMRIGENDDIQVGDMISFDIYHPCTTMDKWRNVLLIDDYFNVIDVYCSEF